MNLIESFVHNPVKVSVGVILVVMFGIIALVAMPMQLTPEVEVPTLTIETMWPGASPQEVETEIVHEQEEQLKSVEGVTKMTSESMDSMGRVTLEFPVGTDMGEALLKVNTKLSQVQEYPEDADEPVINTSNANNQAIAWFILGQRVPSRAEAEELCSACAGWPRSIRPSGRGCRRNGTSRRSANMRKTISSRRWSGSKGSRMPTCSAAARRSCSSSSTRPSWPRGT
jgi:HAE1 family hydrophobic/amphiphilic exporter-1